MRLAVVLLLLLDCAACRRQVIDGAADSGSDSTSTSPAGDPVGFTVVGFNVESGGSDPQVVADEAVALVEGEAIWGFAEVQDDSAAKILVKAAKDPGSDQDWKYQMGTTGFSDRLVLAWDDARFELESYEELDDINVGGTARAPLVGHLRSRENGARLELVVNHLWRSETAKRHQQAQLLNAWGAGESGPILMIGDYNFDWDVTTGEHDQGYDLLTEDDVFTWVEPKKLVKTECSSFYDSVLDFSFVAGDAQTWKADAEIVFPDRDYCQFQDEYTWSDHRPVQITLEMPAP